MIKSIVFLTVLLVLVSNAHSAYINITNDADYKTAINNAKYDATIVDLMSSTCWYSNKMRPIFESLSTQYTNFLFAEVYIDNYFPSYNLVPDLYNGSPFGLPVMMVYKKGVKVDGSPAIRNQTYLESMIQRNGGVKSA